MANNPNSAAHWCKSVVEQATSKPGSSATAAPSMWSGMNMAAPTAPRPAVTAFAAPMAKVDPSYMQYYQQMYSYPAGSAAVAPSSSAIVTPTVSSSFNTMAPVAPTQTYKAALAQNMAKPVVPAISAPTPAAWPAHFGTTTWNNPPSMPIVQPGPTPVVAAMKPNPSRFALAPAPSPVEAPKAQAQPQQQPASLKEFVKRSFATCRSDEERNYVSKELQKVLAKVTAEGRLNVHKWELEPAIVYPQPVVTPVQKQPLKVDPMAAYGLPNSFGQGSATGVMGSVPSCDSNISIEGKKRKSRFEMDAPAPAPSPAKVEKAAKKPVLVNADLSTPAELKMREQRAFRFQQAEEQAPAPKKRRPSMDVVQPSNGEFDMESLKIVGTSQRLEKDYFRLTSAPQPSAVRPPAVLKKALQFIKTRWDNDEVDYIYMCSQLKSIRQDLMVQHAQDDFTVHVYETHARVALESDDLNEYNQCQTQLKQLYHMGFKGSEMEFVAYRILYYVNLLDNLQYSAGSTDTIFLLQSLTPEARGDPAVQHALAMHQAVYNDNYHRFFRLYGATPNMGSCIMDLMLDSMRIKALLRMNKGYKPNVDVHFVLKELAFDLSNPTSTNAGHETVSHDDLLQLVIHHTDLADKKEEKKEEVKEEPGKGKKKRKGKKKDAVVAQIGHPIQAMRHSDHTIQHIMQSNLFAGLQFLYKAGCKIYVEDGAIMWDTKTSTIRAAGDEKALL